MCVYFGVLSFVSRYTLDEFSNARRAAVVRSFIDALTRGGSGGTPRPIELHSHDPLRYLGDMLAWVHQGTASEEEHLQALFKKCSKIGNLCSASASERSVSLFHAPFLVTGDY